MDITTEILVNFERQAQLQQADIVLAWHVDALGLSPVQAQAVAVLQAEYRAVSLLFLHADEMLRRLGEDGVATGWSDLYARQWRESLERLHAAAGSPRRPI